MFEVFIVSEAVSATLQSADFVVDAFERSGGNRFVVPFEQAATVGQQGVAHGLQDADAGGVGAAAPIGEELLGRRLGRLLPELSQIVLDLVRGG